MRLTYPVFLSNSHSAKETQHHQKEHGDISVWAVKNRGCIQAMWEIEINTPRGGK